MLHLSLWPALSAFLQFAVNSSSGREFSTLGIFQQLKYRKSVGTSQHQLPLTGLMAMWESRPLLVHIYLIPSLCVVK